MTESPYKSATGIARVVRATRNSLEGLAAALAHEPAFRMVVAGAALAVPLGVWLGHDGVERALLVGSVLAVAVAELVNAAIEATVDRISLERHPLAKRAKDIGSAAVMLSLVNAAVIWALVIFAR